MKWLDDVFARIGVVVDSRTESKESSVNSMTPSIIPLQAQEKRRTSQDSQRLREHLDKQFASHAQNNAMLMHKGDCDIFVCTGCDIRTPDKIVSAPYQVDTYRPVRCLAERCSVESDRGQKLCEWHMRSKCSITHCIDTRVDNLAEKEDLCMMHWREYQMMYLERNESRNPDQTRPI